MNKFNFLKFSALLTAFVALTFWQCSLLEDEPDDSNINPANTTPENTNNPNNTNTSDTGNTITPAIDPDSGINGPDAPVNPIDSTVMNDESSITATVDPSTASIIPTSPYAHDPTAASTTAIASDPFSDGSAARLAANGTVQYFYGILSDNGTPVPVVKIINAVSADVVDVAVVFTPKFTDNTWGANGIGWPNRQWKHLVGSDMVELQFLNGNGDVVLHCKIDLISPAPSAPSGYACLGLGGDGELISGNASTILSFGSSLDDNINYYGYNGPEILGTNGSSPPTDSVYTPNPLYPNWQYYTVFRVSLDPDAFGPSGYGGVMMTTVHASPAKSSSDLIEVTPGPGPTPGSPDDPFRFFTPVTPDTSTVVPPDTTITPPDTIDIPG